MRRKNERDAVNSRDAKLDKTNKGDPAIIVRQMSSGSFLITSTFLVHQQETNKKLNEMRTVPKSGELSVQFLQTTLYLT